MCPGSAWPCCSAQRAAKHVGDREVSRQNGALNFWSCCSSRCPWTAGFPAPALGAGLRLLVTLLSGSAFWGTRDSLPVPGCRLSRDSAAESLSVLAALAVSAVPWESAAWLGSGLLWVRLARCPRQVPVLRAPRARSAEAASSRAALPAALALSGSQAESPVRLVWISLALCEPRWGQCWAWGSRAHPRMSSPAFSSHAARIRLLQPVIPGLLGASCLPPGCSLGLGGSSASSLPGACGAQGEPGTLGAAGTFPGCCRWNSLCPGWALEG